MYISPNIARDLYVGAYRERAERDASSGALIMKPCKAQRRLAWISLGAALLASANFIAALGTGPAAFWWPAALLCSVMIVGSVMSLLSLRRRLRLSAAGIVSRPLLGRESAISWGDISWVRFRGRSLRIETKQGRTIVIPASMSGTKDLEEMMAQHLPFQVYGMAFMKYWASLKSLPRSA